MTILCILACVLGILSLTAADDRCKPDLGLVVDTTKSLGYNNIPYLKEALRLLVKEFNIAENETHVSLETFNKEAQVLNKFNDPSYWSLKAITDLINTSIDKLKSPTRLDYALEKANGTMFAETNGDRPGERNVLVVITDGRTHENTDLDKYLAYIKDLKSKGVRLVAIAIGPDSSREQSQKRLKELGGENVFHVTNYKILHDVVKNVSNLICPPHPCKDVATDVAFLVDRTKSVGLSNYRMLKGFLLQLSDAIAIGPDDTHVGYILFAKQPDLLNTFANTKYHSRENVHSLITNISDDLGGLTFIDRALLKANDSLFTPAGGDRPENPNVLILMTDGRTNDASRPFSEIVPSLRDDKHVRMVALGVGNYQKFQKDLKEIAGEKNVYLADNFDELSDLFDEILVETCSVDGRFSDWSDWSDCKDGMQERTRTCTKPPPNGKGKKCEGEPRETRPCPQRRSSRPGRISEVIDALNLE